MKKIFFAIVLLLVTSISFVSCSNKSEDEVITPSVTSIIASITTTNATSINDTTAVVGGIVTAEGASAITARGICWSTVANPSTGDHKTTETGTTGAFSSTLKSLTPNTLYYARAYATNSLGTAYGNHTLFITQDSPLLISYKYNNVAYNYAAGTYDSTKKEIKGEGGTTTQLKKISLFMPLSPTVGTHNITFSTTPNPNSYEGHFESQAEGLILNGTTGTINITSITNTRIIGTFSFTGLDSTGATVSITDGVFSAKRNQ